MPSDLKRVFTRSASASKQAVTDVVLGQVTDLAAFLDRLPAGQHEHVTDAAGHALLGLREMAEMRRMMGVAVHHMRTEGVPVTEIAERVGLSERRVWQILAPAD